MNKHVTAVGVLHLGVGILGMLVAIVLVVVLVGVGFMVYAIDGDPEPLPILTAVSIGTGIVLTIVSLPSIVAGIGVLKHRSWARYLAMILGAVSLLNIPIGTALGGYTLWVLLHDESEELFS